MNLMKKIVGAGSRAPTAASTSHDHALGLMHLRKLFAEFRHPSAGATQKDQEEKLYSMLPLFCKVFESTPSSEMTEKFGDVLQFCSHVSKLMVTEIRRRASNQSTVEASCAIVTFLEIESHQETSNGWSLLTTLNLLCTGVSALIDCMTAASLPSTLVKCLYLFFDLPPMENSTEVDANCQFSLLERRVLLQKILVQVLVRLCNHPSPAEELSRKDDLSLLFSAITSWCPPHNMAWRKSAAEVLMTLSRHGLTTTVVRYIHDKGCMRHCIENMRRVQELSPIEIVEMFVTVFCFLKDSSEVSQTLLDDFKACQGYVFLSEFLLRLELDEAEDSKQALRNLVLLVGSLVTCGFIEVKPSHVSTGSLFHIPGFTLPQPVGKGVTVRNVQAFQVLQSVFLKATHVHLCATILDVISSIYHQDSANYFILEAQHTLSQFAEKIHLKPSDIQLKFFELLEFVVFDLNFVPCKELISLSILIKSNHVLSCSILCVKSLTKILRFHTTFKEAFREVGLLEVLVTCMHRYASLLKEPPHDNEIVEISQEEQDFGMLIMTALTVALSGCPSNANVFRECGGARCAHNMVPYKQCRQLALNMVQQLVLSPGGDDDMGTLLGLMHTAPIESLELKTQILKSLLNVLRESHRTRTVFRKVGGFVYVMSVLVSMEGSLAEPKKPPWDHIRHDLVLAMLKTVFSTLTVAMRYEPANAKFFRNEVRYDSLTEAVRLLGCFGTQNDLPAVDEVTHNCDQYKNAFDRIFHHPADHGNVSGLPSLLISADILLRYLYDMAIDSFDKPQPINQLQVPAPAGSTSSPSLKRLSSDRGVEWEQKRASTGSINEVLTRGHDVTLVHAGATMSIFHLLPAIHDSSHPQVSLSLQLYITDVLVTLLRSERNQQLMCDVGFPHELLCHGNVVLADESHPMHAPFQSMFERLSSQHLTPRDLRDFLRLGSPLNCRPIDDIYGSKSTIPDTDQGPVSRSTSIEENFTPYELEKKLKTAGGAVPLTRVKCLVSMTTPKDTRMHGTAVTPAFVEFDMNPEGFGCLYLPSIAPQGPPAPSVVSGVVNSPETVVIGGIGTGERVFPPQSGLTISTWFCVDKFSDQQVDGHPVRLLTVVRNLQGREENMSCLSIKLSCRDRSIIVSTQETLMPVAVPSGASLHEDTDAAVSGNTARFWCPQLTQDSQWNHVVLVFQRAGMMKYSNVAMYVNGSHITTHKLHYISPNLGGGGTASPTAFTSVYAYIGTPPQLRRISSLKWRQGPCYMIEDAILPSLIQTLYDLGPNYVGSLQAPITEDGDNLGVLVPEEKLVYGIHAHAISQMTIAKIRKIYNKVDSKSIAKLLAMSAHDNITPIRILHNTAAHLSGVARSLGAIVMGYQGVRTFCPRPVAKMLENVGGAVALLGLIAMTTDVEGLYASVKALVCIVRSSKSAMRDMDRVRGYQTLAMLYKQKRHLLNSHILHLTFSLVGTVDSGRETSVIPNRVAFEDLLCDLEVWREAPGDLHRTLYEHFYELITDSSEQKANLQLMCDIGLVPRLLHILKDPRLTHVTLDTVATLLTMLLYGTTNHTGLLRLGQYMVCTLPVGSQSERHLDISRDDGNDNSELCLSKNDENLLTDGGGDGCPTVHTVRMRNRCLKILVNLVCQPGTAVLNMHVCDDVQKVLGFDWLLLFLHPLVHPSSVVLAFRILVSLLSNTSGLDRFREGSVGGGWLYETETVLKNQLNALLGFNVGQNVKDSNREVNKEACHIPGFQALQWILPQHCDIPELYYMLMALLLGQPIRALPHDIQLNLDMIWTVIFGAAANKPMEVTTAGDLCGDAAVVILAMIRFKINQPVDMTPHASADYPLTVLQFFLFLYHNHVDFSAMCMGGEFLAALSATLLPYKVDGSDSEVSTPDDAKFFLENAEGVNKLSSQISTTSSLTSHSSRKFIMDFLRTIVVDSMSKPASNRTNSVIDLLLELEVEGASRSQKREFITELLRSVMEHLLAGDVLLGEQAAVNAVSGSSNYSTMANGVFYLTNRIVDKLWQGMYIGESKEIFDFVSKLIMQAKRKAFGVSLDQIYKCLNRTILFQLSRSVDTVTTQASVLDSLHKITNHRGLVFGPGNYDSEFLGCLCHCLLQLTDSLLRNSEIAEIKARTTTWHVNHDSISGEIIQKTVAMASDLHEGLQLVATASRRVWDELYISKKPQLEELFKVQLNNIDGSPANLSTPDLSDVRPIIQEAVGKIWIGYAETERKVIYMQPDRLHTQLHNKLQKVGTGMLKFAARKTKKELPLKASPLCSIQQNDFFLSSQTHTSIVKDLVTLQYKQYLQSNKYMEKYLLEEWTQTETELLRERGLWGPPVASALDKWMLDPTEGPGRMRKKMKSNELFYIHYPYRPDMDAACKYKVALSWDSKKYYQRYRSCSFLNRDALPLDIGQITPEATPSDPTDNTDLASTRYPTLIPRHRIMSSITTDEEDIDDTSASLDTPDPDRIDNQSDGPPISENKTDNMAIHRIIGDGEKISHMFRCARIQGLDTAEGLLFFGREHFYIIDGFTLLSSKEIKDIDSLPPNFHEPIIPKASKSSGSSQKRMCSKFAYEDIREVHKRRYLLQPIGVEVFSSDGRNYLLAFPRPVRNKVYTKFTSVATAITDDAHQSVSGQKQSAKVEPGTGLISSLMGEKSVTQRWERGEINNFQYLMHVNTLAGRSYNDLMQYPVFPWIVRDYTSEELDLNNPLTFRDLSKPMGAQTPERLKQFHKRFHDWDDPQGETPPYHYGTHYSSAMIVASYLVRMEPFTQHFLKLQGGHFDLADRMFHSIKENWLSASKHNMADVKELIPEFFYLPEMFDNSNNFDLGAKQNGEELNDAILPLWAKNDPLEFIRAHREALESDYVSCHLHEWIDLIFGYKQTGPAAVEAVNVFHHLFYEGNVDIYSIDDPLKKNATIGFINNFGQIPKQLFKKPHPQKKLNSRLLDPIPVGSSFNDRLFFHCVDNLRPTMQPMKEVKGAVGQILATDKYVLAVEQNKVLIPGTYNKFLAWGFADLSLRIGTYESEKALAVFECVDNGEILCADAPNPKLFVTAGTSCVVDVWEYTHRTKQLSLKQALYGHTEPVTCVCASQPYNVIVSGSRDRTCIVWDMSRLVFVRQLRGHMAPISAICINDLTGDIATCAGTYLYMWTINGQELAVVNTATTRSQQILCVSMSQQMEWDNRNVILTGSSDGVVRMWSMEYVQVPHERKEKPSVSDTIDDAPDDKPVDDADKTTSGAQTRPMKIPRLQRKESCDSYESHDRSVLERLNDFKDPDYISSKRAVLGSSVDSEYQLTNHSEILESISDVKDGMVGQTDDNISMEDEVYSADTHNPSRCPDRQSAQSVDLAIDTAIDALDDLESKEEHLRNPCDSGENDLAKTCPDQSSKGDDNHDVCDEVLPGTAEYVMITEKEVKQLEQSQEHIMSFGNKMLSHLREGFKWKRQLVFRSKLTMHTAFERKDNREPAAVTAISMSRDHKTVYVGDTKGRVFSWSVTDQPGRVVADHWMKDEGVDCCLSCGVKFSFSERRHHCRNCGQLFCSKCSRFETEIRRLRIVKPVRVCQACYNILKAQQAAEAMANIIIKR